MTEAKEIQDNKVCEAIKKYNLKVSDLDCVPILHECTVRRPLLGPTHASINKSTTDEIS